MLKICQLRLFLPQICFRTLSRLSESCIFVSVKSRYQDVRRAMPPLVHLVDVDGRYMGLLDYDRVRNIFENRQLLVVDLFKPQKDKPTCRLITRSGLKVLQDAQKQLMDQNMVADAAKPKKTATFAVTTAIEDAHLRMKAKNAEKHLANGSRVKITVTKHRFRNVLTSAEQCYQSFLSYIQKELISKTVEVSNPDKSKFIGEIRSYKELDSKVLKAQRKQAAINLASSRLVFDFVEEKAYHLDHDDQILPESGCKIEDS